MAIDLSLPILRQADILSAVPGLKEKSLQNWYQRGILTNSDQAVQDGLVDSINPGRQSKRRANCYGLLVIAVMYELGRLGIDPADARDVGFEVAARANEIAQRSELDPVDRGQGWELPVPLEFYDSFSRMVLTARSDLNCDDGTPSKKIPGKAIGKLYRLSPLIEPDDKIARFLSGTVSIVIESDALIFKYLNNALRTSAGLALANTGSVTK